MRQVQDLRIEDYSYELPEERIAKYPLGRRDASRLLVYDRGTIGERTFADLPDLLPERSLLVRNNSRVLRARLHFARPTGAVIEVFCLDPVGTSYEQALGDRHTSLWHCLTGNARRWRIGTTLTHTLSLADRVVELCAERVAHDVVRFSWSSDAYTFGDMLEALGTLPIPPYLNRPTEQSDLSTYQTVYARAEGSVAAPTAGLHFTPEVFEALERRGVETLDLTLHVGAGTFRPVKSATIGEHAMHSELIALERSTLERLHRAVLEGAPIVAVGTTSVRTLESLYHLGRSVLEHPDLELSRLAVAQWAPYTAGAMPTPREALEALLVYTEHHGLSRLVFPTSILIAPGYRFAMVQGLVTNFHQPNSTLLLLISAFVGPDWRRIYRYALDEGFRFLSYGDSSLLLPM